MKNKIALLLVVPALLLCACSSSADPSDTQTPQVSEFNTYTVSPTPYISTSTPKSTSTATPKSTPSDIALTSAEIDFFSGYLSEIENNGFLQTAYNKPSEMELNEALYNGAGCDNVTLSEDEKKLYAQISGEEIMTDITKLTTAQINSVLKEKTGSTFKDITTKLNWTYLEKYDAYYFQHGDTNWTTIKCVSGYKTSSDLYVIKYKGSYIADNNGTCTVTLQKKGTDYLFISNTKD